ncbi:hypothetical protein [Aquimarina longa]|uniref:hypothetical protein n=1 Tax=Aquimarina longa TaxID=1080221 RepID=UPI0007866EA2|nr:hypothetical protein [Aquimarina longa]
MKIQIKSIFIFSLFVLFIFISCRKEYDDEVVVFQDEILKANSTVANLILKTVMNDGYSDNILDDSGCYTIKLPVTITINDSKIIIKSEEDFIAIEEISDQADNDTDVINFTFPITLIYDDFSEMIVTDKNALERLVNRCNDQVQNIGCVNFKYPFYVSVFNIDKELIKTIMFNTDKEVYNFINTIDTKTLSSLRFPISLVLLNDNTEIIIKDLKTLESTINNKKNNCYNTNLTVKKFSKEITRELLKVEKYINNGDDKTKNYNEFIFNFSSNNRVTIVSNDDDDDDDSIVGKWDISTRANGKLMITFNFGDKNPLNILNNKWYFWKIKDKSIMLNDDIGNQVVKKELFFTATSGSTDD